MFQKMNKMSMSAYNPVPYATADTIWSNAFNTLSLAQKINSRRTCVHLN